MSAQPVDVLAHLASMALAYGEKWGEIHNAVAELIEAAEALADSQGGPWERGNAYISARGAENMNAAMKRVRAALARVQGGQS